MPPGKPPLDKAVGRFARNLADLLVARGFPRELLEVAPEDVISAAKADAEPSTVILAEAHEVALRTRDNHIRQRYKELFRGTGDERLVALDALAALRQEEPSYGFAAKRFGKDPFAERRAALAAFYDDSSLTKALAYVSEARAKLHLAAEVLQQYASARKELDFALFKKPWVHEQLLQAGRLQRAWRRWIRRGQQARHVIVPACLFRWQKSQVIQPAQASDIEIMLCHKRVSQKTRLLSPRRKFVRMRLRRLGNQPLRSRRWLAQALKCYKKHHREVSNSKWDQLVQHARFEFAAVQALEAHVGRAMKPHPNVPDCVSEWDQFCYTVGAKLEHAGMPRADVVRLLTRPSEALRSAEKRIESALDRYKLK